MDDTIRVESTDISIRGMTCDHCVARVEAAVREIPGVEDVRAVIGLARVAYHPEFASRVEIEKRIEGLGYRIMAVDGQRRGRIAGWLDRMARSNKETFGEGRPSCCTLGRTKAPGRG